MGRKQKKIHYIYKTTCSVNGKYYIGMHSTDKMEDGYLGSGKRLRVSINYHGKDNHTKEILEYCENRDKLKEREKEIVNKQLLSEDLCMNLIIGGEGGRGFTSEEQRENAKKSNEKQKILRETNPEWVKKKSEKQSISLRKQYDEDGRERKYFYDWNGRKHSEESKRKMGESNKHQKGKNNSQYGTCWITRNRENKKIKKEELSYYTSQGWVKGRK